MPGLLALSETVHPHRFHDSSYFFNLSCRIYRLMVYCFHTDTEDRMEPMKENNAPKPLEDIVSGLDTISHTLEQMLALAELSASDLNLDRDALQKMLDRLKDRIDQIADRIGTN